MSAPYEWRYKRMERVRKNKKRYIAAFNKRFPEGSAVQLLLDSGEVVQTTVRWGASLANKHQRTSAWFDGVSGGYHIGCVQAPEGERPFFRK